MTDLDRIDWPEEWHRIAETLSGQKSVAIVVGTSDTGKTTLARFLVDSITVRGCSVSLVDADIGQSTLGPPTTIGLSLFDSPPCWESVSAHEIFFVGTNTPEDDPDLHVQGTMSMVKRAQSQSADVTIVDTTGLATGDLGYKLKTSKIDLIRPKFIVAIERMSELESLLEIYQGQPWCTIFRLRPSEHALQRTREERRAYRKFRYGVYFRGSTTKDCALKDIKFQGRLAEALEYSLLSGKGRDIAGLLVGLMNSDATTLGVGRLVGFDPEKGMLKIDTPLEDLSDVKIIQPGFLRIDKDYEELRF